MEEPLTATGLKKTVLWIDDVAEQREFGHQVLKRLPGVRPFVVASSAEARAVLETEHVDAVVTDILRRHESRPDVDGYQFFLSDIRPGWPSMPVVFHTKNLPDTFQTDDASYYLSKWEEPAKKTVELEMLLHDRVRLYEAFADHSFYTRIEPRLVEVHSRLLKELRDPEEIWSLDPDRFEELVAEVLQRSGFHVLWIPGGQDGGVDVIAGCDDHRYLIDVKRYRSDNPVSVELVRRIYGVAEAAGKERPELVTRGGIITSSRFTRDAEAFRDSVRERPLLRDGDWLMSELARYAPRFRAAQIG